MPGWEGAVVSERGGSPAAAEGSTSLWPGLAGGAGSPPSTSGMASGGGEERGSGAAGLPSGTSAGSSAAAISWSGDGGRVVMVVVHREMFMGGAR